MHNLGQGVQAWIAFSREGTVQGFAGQMGFTGQCGHIPDPGGGHVFERYLEQLYVTFRQYLFKILAAVSGSFSMSLPVSASVTKRECPLKLLWWPKGSEDKPLIEGVSSSHKESCVSGFATDFVEKLLADTLDRSLFSLPVPFLQE